MLDLLDGFRVLFSDPYALAAVLVTVAAAATAAGDSKACDMWSSLENQTIQLEEKGHANCTTNEGLIEHPTISCCLCHRIRNLSRNMSACTLFMPASLSIESNNLRSLHSNQ